MMLLDKCLIILDGYFEIDYRIKRKVVDEFCEVQTYDEFIDKSTKLFNEYIKDFDDSIKYLDIYKNRINNWASCDLTISNLKVVKNKFKYKLELILVAFTLYAVARKITKREKEITRLINELEELKLKGE